MSDIVDRYVRISDAIGQAKSSPQIEKKKGDKPATANPATKDGLQVQCQLCRSEHSAIDCPLHRDLQKKSAVRRGDLLPGPPDKDDKRRGAKDDAGDESQDDFGDKVCHCASYARNLSFVHLAKHEITRLKSADGCLQSTSKRSSKMLKRPSKRIKLAKRTRRRANEILSRVISRRRQFQIRTTNRHRLGQAAKILSGQSVSIANATTNVATANANAP
jgi:hypothetical protein